MTKRPSQVKGAGGELLALVVEACNLTAEISARYARAELSVGPDRDGPEAAEIRRTLVRDSRDSAQAHAEWRKDLEEGARLGTLETFARSLKGREATRKLRARIRPLRRHLARMRRAEQVRGGSQ